MIDHFLAASRHGNLRLAAKELSLTQTALTKSIQSLEGLLGVRLFDRSSRGVTLTQSGRHLARRAIKIQAECDFLEREMEDLREGRVGEMTIGAGTVWSSVLLPGVLAGIQRKRPGASFVVLRSVGRRFQEQLQNLDIDLGLGNIDHTQQVEGGLHFEPLATFRTAYFARKDHPLHQVSDLALVDLAAYQFAMFRLDDALFGQVCELFRNNGMATPVQQYLAESMTSVMQVVAMTDHITCLPEPFLPIAKSYGLFPLPLSDAPKFQSGAIYRQEAAGYPLLETVLEALRESGGQLTAGSDLSSLGQ